MTTQYLGFDVIATQPDEQADNSTTYERAVSIVASSAGVRQVFDKTGATVTVRDAVWTAHGRAAISTMRSFLLERRGRVVPFWCPTYQPDLTLAEPAAAGVTSIKVVSTGYARMLFASGAQYRYVAFAASDGSISILKVVDAVENADGTDSIAFDAPIPAALQQAQALSFAALVRLESDEFTLNYVSAEVAEVSLRLVAVPKETPAV